MYLKTEEDVQGNIFGTPTQSLQDDDDDDDDDEEDDDEAADKYCSPCKVKSNS